MKKKYILLSLFIFFVLALSGYFLYVIFSDNKDGTVRKAPSLPTSSLSKPNPKQLEVTMSANPAEINALPEDSTTNLKDVEKITLNITYKNNTSSNPDKFQIQILNGQTLKYLTGSTLTAKFNKEDTATNKRATYDLEAVKPGESKTASIFIYAYEPGVLDFRAFVTTKGGPSATSLPVSVIVR
jgi:flagellar basal body-associated protein FliL